MSEEVAKDFCDMKKTNLPGTFGTAGDAAGDHARGTKREGGAIEVPKRHKIAFVKSGEGSSQDDIEDVLGAVKELAKGSGAGPSHMDEPKASCSTSATTSKPFANEHEPATGCSQDMAINVFEVVTEPETIDYMEELSQVRCVAAPYIAEHMFNTKFGKLVLLARLWQPKLSNIISSCQFSSLQYEFHYDEMTAVSSIIIEGKVVARSHEATKKEGKKVVENLAWNILTNEAITVLVKEQFISQDDARISFPEGVGDDQHGPRDDEFGAPVEAGVAARMMQMMGWQGGGLGVDGQGIAEPVRPHMQMINRAGLGSVDANIHQIKKAADGLMKRYLESDCIDVDLIFSSDFTKEERAAVHSAASRNRLMSRSYGHGTERFLVVKKKINIFNLAKEVASKGGDTPKYKLYVPAKVTSYYRERE